MPLDAQTYLDHATHDGERITGAAPGLLDVQVPTCPGNTIGSLLLHTAGACRFWTDVLKVKGLPPPPDWSTWPSDPVEAHRTMHQEFIDEIGSHDPTEITWTFGTDGPVAFWYRRSAQELAVHRWDVENAAGMPNAIDATLAMDGIDEIAEAFGPKSDHAQFRGVSERFGGDGQTFCFEATDIDAARTLTMRPELVELAHEAKPADVTVRGTASDLLLLLWGRVSPRSLEVTGDASLVDRWQERVKI
jgi:uncharacterized protein (TIGR03083 family)